MSCLAIGLGLGTGEHGNDSGIKINLAVNARFLYSLAAVARKRKQKRAARIVGICEDAVTLGCNRRHLQLVLTGGRESKPLRRRYQELKRQQRAGAANPVSTAP